MNEPAPLDQLVIEIKFYSQQTALNMIEVGKRLLQAKEQVKHGEWEQWLETKVDISYRSAARLMQIARECANLPTLATLPTSKIIAVIDLPPEQREPFVREHPIDEMTARQVQAAVKAQKAAETRAQEAEQRADKLSKSLEQARTKAAAVDNMEAENEHLRTANQLLENKIKTVGDPIIVEQPVQVFPPDYERVKRENAELKAKQQNISLQQLAQVDENCRQYAKTAAEEEKAAKIVDKVLSALLDLPDGAEINELARCYLKLSPADKQNEIIVTCMEIETGIQRLRKLNDAIKNSTKLKVVK